MNQFCPDCGKKTQVKDGAFDPETGVYWRRYWCPEHPRQDFQPTYEITQKQLAELAGALREASLFAKTLLSLPLWRKEN